MQPKSVVIAPKICVIPPPPPKQCAYTHNSGHTLKNKHTAYSPKQWSSTHKQSLYTPQSTLYPPNKAQTRKNSAHAPQNSRSSPRNMRNAPKNQWACTENSPHTPKTAVVHPKTYGHAIKCGCLRVVVCGRQTLHCTWRTSVNTAAVPDFPPAHDGTPAGGPIKLDRATGQSAEKGK